MVRRPRRDYPGSWHHVANRGIARRPLFESGADIRFFLSRLAREVRRGRIEIHAYCILTTHFHLLVRSPVGELSEAMRQAQNAYSRRFNRLHHRDGSLVRGRFFSKPVEDDRYWRTLVRYIDHNPERARIVSKSESYPFCSAFHYFKGSGPPWLERSRVEAEATSREGASPYSWMAYQETFGAHAGMALAELEDLVERRMRARSSVDPLNDLINTTPIEVQRWMERKAMLADGHVTGLPVCSPLSLERALDWDEAERGTWRFKRGESLVSARSRAFNGLAHELAGLAWSELAKREGGSSMRCRRLGLEHHELVERDAGYRERTAQVVRHALDQILRA